MGPLTKQTCPIDGPRAARFVPPYAWPHAALIQVASTPPSGLLACENHLRSLPVARVLGRWVASKVDYLQPRKAAQVAHRRKLSNGIVAWGARRQRQQQRQRQRYGEWVEVGGAAQLRPRCGSWTAQLSSWVGGILRERGSCARAGRTCCCNPGLRGSTSSTAPSPPHRLQCTQSSPMDSALSCVSASSPESTLMRLLKRLRSCSPVRASRPSITEIRLKLRSSHVRLVWGPRETGRGVDTYRREQWLS